MDEQREHLDENRVVRLFRGELPDDDLADVDRHVDACAVCEHLIATIARSSLLAPGVADTIPEPHVPSTIVRTRIAEATTLEKIDLPPTPAERYAILSLIGRGGMGEVFETYDHALDRAVALKRVRKDRADRAAHARFVDEARQTAQLEHPNIIPLHDAGRLENGAPFYTMKRVSGTTLREVIHKLALGDDDFQQRFTQRRLLRALATVSLAVDYAHSRGIIHRDLKPENVMFGDFGEVYVLDWGLAKPFKDVHEVPTEEPTTRPRLRQSETAAGTVAGTPGYMAPEQSEPALGPLGPYTDVFALGQLLFEVLTRRAVAVQPRARMLIPELVGADPRLLSDPEEPEVPPELRDAFERATDPRPRSRMQSARELAELVERYLEGDRDLERRQEISIEHVATADTWLERALDGEVPDLEGRHRAMRELGRALALDPDNRSALVTMQRLLTEPPHKLPYEVRDRLDAASDETVRLGARLNARLQLLWLAALPLALWMGVRDWVSLSGLFVCMAVAGGMSFVVSRQRKPWLPLQLAVVVVTTLGGLFLSRALGSLVLVPTLGAVFAVGMQTHPLRMMRRAGYASGLLVVGLPIALELAGVLPNSYSFRGDELVIHAQMVGFSRDVALTVLLAFFFLLITGGVAFVYRLRVALTAAEERLHLHAWHLERFVPDEPAAEKTDR